MSDWEKSRPALPRATSNGLKDKNATEILRSHSRRFHADWKASIGATISGESYFRHSLRRAQAKECIFNEVDFSRVSGNGSLWVGSKFHGCKFDRSVFLYSDFSWAEFKDAVNFDGANFSGSMFNNAKFIDTSLVGSSFAECNFHGALIKNCRVESSTFEDSEFSDAELTDLDLANTNIEYADFTDAKIQSVRVSLAQFSYVFGISSQHIEEEKLVVSTSNPSFPERYLPWKELLDLVPTIISHYRECGEEFPYANLMFMSGYLDELKATINSGILTCRAAGRFRDLKYLSKLARTSGLYSRDDLQNLYDIIKFSWGEGCSGYDARILSRYEGDFRKYLLDMDDGGVNLSFRITPLEAAPNNLLPWLLDRLERGCSLQGIPLRWDRLESTIASPGYLSGRARIQKERALDRGERDRVSREKASLIIGALGAIFGAISAVPTLLPQQQSEFERIREEVKAAIILENFYASVDRGMVVRLGKDGKLIWPEGLPSPGKHLGGSCASPVGKD